MLKLQDVATVESEVQSRITSFHLCSFANVLRTLKSQMVCMLLLGEIVPVMQSPPRSQD